MILECEIRRIVGTIDVLSSVSCSLGEDDDLFEKGLDSFGSVQLMLALEEQYGIEFPDHLLNRRSFSSLRAIRDAVALLTAGVEA